jgi:hypothetical protein
MEGRLETVLPGTLLDTKPLNPRAKLLLRIADSRPHGTLTRYDLRYVGFVPGKYDLRDYLVRKDGSSTADLPNLAVEVAGILPAQHAGELVPQQVGPFSALGGYRTGLILVSVLWAVLAVPLWLSRRRKKAPALAPVAIAPPTLAERLQPLVKRAAEGRLSTDELAQLERMLLNHWRERLQLGEVSMAEAIQRLRSHPEGGELLRQLEGWLHRPPGLVSVDVTAMLAPYATVSATSS